MVNLTHLAKGCLHSLNRFVFDLCVSQIALSQENKLLVILSEAPAQSGTPCHSERRFIGVEHFLSF